MAEAKSKRASRKKKTQPEHWKRRVARYEEVDPNDLLAHPLNYKIHSEIQQGALTSTMEHIGWIDEVKVNDTTGFIVDGHLRVAAAIENGQPTVPVAYLDLTEEEEKTALATFDPLGFVYYESDNEAIATLINEMTSTTEPIQRMIEAWATNEGIEFELEDIDIDVGGGGPQDDAESLTSSAPLSDVRTVTLLMPPDQYQQFEVYIAGLAPHFGADLKQTDVVVSAVHYAYSQLIGKNQS